MPARNSRLPAPRCGVLECGCERVRVVLAVIAGGADEYRRHLDHAAGTSESNVLKDSLASDAVIDRSPKPLGVLDKLGEREDCLLAAGRALEQPVVRRPELA